MKRPLAVLATATWLASGALARLRHLSGVQPEVASRTAQAAMTGCRERADQVGVAVVDRCDDDCARAGISAMEDLLGFGNLRRTTRKTRCPFEYSTAR